MKKRTYYLICMGVILVIALIMSVKGGLFSAGERAEIFRGRGGAFMGGIKRHLRYVKLRMRQDGAPFCAGDGQGKI